MAAVIIADDRPKWMQEEDRRMACMSRCSLFKRCSSLLGMDCKSLGGTEIPKLGGRKDGKQAKKEKTTRKGNYSKTQRIKKRKIGEVLEKHIC